MRVTKFENPTGDLFKKTGRSLYLFEGLVTILCFHFVMWFFSSHSLFSSLLEVLRLYCALELPRVPLKVDP